MRSVSKSDKNLQITKIIEPKWKQYENKLQFCVGSDFYFCVSFTKKRKKYTEFSVFTCQVFAKRIRKSVSPSDLTKTHFLLYSLELLLTNIVKVNNVNHLLLSIFYGYESLNRNKKTNTVKMKYSFAIEGVQATTPHTQLSTQSVNHTIEIYQEISAHPVTVSVFLQVLQSCKGEKYLLLQNDNIPRQQKH